MKNNALEIKKKEREKQCDLPVAFVENYRQIQRCDLDDAEGKH